MKKERLLELRRKVADAVDKNTGELADSRRMITFNPATVIELLDAIEALEARVTELQAANTRLLEERRAVDVHYNVEHFHRVMDIPVLTEPQVPAEERVRLRVKLIIEEFTELLDSVFKVKTPDIVIDHADIDVDLPAFADACADIKYVVVGAELEFGIDGRPVFSGVHEANLKKVGGPRRADGKILKPEGWQPPDIEGELRRQGWRGP